MPVRLLQEDERRRGVLDRQRRQPAAQGVALAARKAGRTLQDPHDRCGFRRPSSMRYAVSAEKVVKASYDRCWQALADRAHPRDGPGAFYIHPFRR